MEKHLIVIGTAVLLLVVGLGGCVDSSELNRYIGTWAAIEYPKDQTNSSALLEITWTFYNNGSMKSIVNLQDNTITNESPPLWYNYALDNNELCISLIIDPINVTSPICYNREFSNSYNRLTLTHESGAALTFNKKS
jgi:hypothetical protein